MQAASWIAGDTEMQTMEDTHAPACCGKAVECSSHKLAHEHQKLVQAMMIHRRPLSTHCGKHAAPVEAGDTRRKPWQQRCEPLRQLCLHRYLVRVPKAEKKPLPKTHHVKLWDILLMCEPEGQRLHALLTRRIVGAAQGAREAAVAIIAATAPTISCRHTL